jgi:hypothetical protein
MTVPAQAAGAHYVTNNFTSTAVLERKRPLLGVRSVTMRYIALDDAGTVTRLAIMFTDSTGVYEIYQPTVGATQPWVVRWMLPNKSYSVMRRADDGVTPPTLSPSNPRDLRAMFARRLDSGEVLVVNGYLGRTRGNTPFTGEVLLLNGDFDSNPAVPGFDFNKRNLGFSQSSIRLQLDQLENVRGLEVPVFADLH